MSKEKDNLNKKVSKIWGGRFSESSSSIMKKFNSSISFDKRLYFHDLALSRAHSAMLAENKIISFAENKKIFPGKMFQFSRFQKIKTFFTTLYFLYLKLH